MKEKVDKILSVLEEIITEAFSTEVSNTEERIQRMIQFLRILIFILEEKGKKEKTRKRKEEARK